MLPENEENEEDRCNFEPDVSWFTYADMYIYYSENKEVKILTDFEEEKVEENPIKLLKDRVDAFLEVMNDMGWEDDYSLIRIVYWLSY
jgi:hypothetical protein